MAIDLHDGRRVFAPGGSDPDEVRAQIESGDADVKVHLALG
ncbi:hypothetical protein [Bradyrhizobium oligotrophicum]|nr:hypothetical protein [Bradyrhizobium oligotrophicum]